MPSACEAAHIVFKNREDVGLVASFGVPSFQILSIKVFEEVLANDWGYSLYLPSMGLWLDKTLHSFYDKYYWSLYYKASFRFISSRT